MAWFPLEEGPWYVFYLSILNARALRTYSVYIFAQVMGGVVGAALVYANYIHAIDLFEGGREIRTLGTAGLFSTYAVRPSQRVYASPSHPHRS